MPPRAIWSGSIAFGLVNVPVKMYAAISEQTLHFQLVHQKDHAPIGYVKVRKGKDEPVSDDDIRKAYALGDDKLVLLEDADFEAAAPERYRAIEILDFVPYEQIDPIYFERTYYLGPDRDAGAVYRLLATAMERTELAAIARFVFHDRERLAALRVREGVITLERLHFADEVRDVEGIAPKDGRKAADRRQLEMAVRLIEQQTRDFDPSRYEDVYRERLLDVIKRKARGETVEAVKPEPQEAPDDLMDALRASLERARGGGGKSAGRNGGAKAGGKSAGRARAAKPRGGRSKSRAAKARGGGKADGLADLTVAELRERAKKADVPGRSRMSREELIEALSAAA